MELVCFPDWDYICEELGWGSTGWDINMESTPTDYERDCNFVYQGQECYLRDSGGGGETTTSTGTNTDTGGSTTTNTGGFTAATSDDDVIEFKEFTSQLPYDLRSYYMDSNNSRLKNSIYQYLISKKEGYDFTIGSKNFAEEAIRTHKDGGQIDLIREILKDSSFINTKADCVLKELISSGNN
ncbi:hypothetical protein [Gramella sp. AN32]|uniref:Uncharacterized protein n=1 Tax=Christiangramia antarctica TaxID=2058158 RepID=A0ABW5X683_9FLAO|nr:hypothetical protein [Gramella sp. AN32]MCM4157889.1 hypothetical protein [Gramella sp. AN32]